MTDLQKGMMIHLGNGVMGRVEEIGAPEEMRNWPAYTGGADGHSLIEMLLWLRVTKFALIALAGVRPGERDLLPIAERDGAWLLAIDGSPLPDLAIVQ